MNATQAMNNLQDLMDEVDGRTKDIKDECERMRAMWIGLGRVGGQRCDSAAEYLKKIRSEVATTAKWLMRVDDQLHELIINPWGEPTKAEVTALVKSEVNT